MSCYYPIDAYRSMPNSAFPKGQIYFVEHKVPGAYTKLKVPCGHCVGCRLRRSREWAIRCTHEAKTHSQNCFITLTFNDESLSKRRNKFLDKRDFQLFMKKLRKRFGSGIRYYHCGEYGEKFGRPHYHACIFGFDFPDKKLWRVINGSKLYRSQALEELWPYGYSSIGAFDFNTAAYVARYVLKKKYGSAASYHYEVTDTTTGEITSVQPEYSTMSRRPGIGAAWFRRYYRDVFPRDHVIVQSREMRPPKYYDKLYEAVFPSDFDRIKTNRVEKAKKNLLDSTPDRLETQARCAEHSIKNLKRSYEA